MIRILLLLASLALVVVLFVRLDPYELGALLAGLGWAAAAFPVLYAVHHAIRTVALALALPEPGAVSYWRLLLVRLSGEAVQYLTFTGPLVAEPTKAWLLRREGLSLVDAAAATLTEYVAYTWTASLISFAGLVALRLLVPLPLPVRIVVSSTAIGVLAVLVLVLVVLGWRRRLISVVVRRATQSSWLARRVTVPEARVRDMEDGLFRNLHDDRRRLAAILGCEVFAHALMVLELYWLLRGFGVDVTWTLLVIVEGANKVSNFLFFFVPARAGTDEATLALVVSTLGVPAVVGLGISLVRRGRSLLTGAAGLAAAWALTRLVPDASSR